jgi:hypothetical protein
MNYYQAQTSINPTQFFNQWYYGQGYPTFDVSWNFVGNVAVIKSSQSTSMPSSVPLFVTPMEYKLTRTSAPDTIIRVMHSANMEIYNIPMLGNVTGVTVDPNNWVINKVVGPTKDITLTPEGIMEDVNDLHIAISPNPSKGIYEIKMPQLEGGTYAVLDVSGKQIMSGDCGSRLTIDISDKANGVYVLQIKDAKDKLVTSRKLIKE